MQMMMDYNIESVREQSLITDMTLEGALSNINNKSQHSQGKIVSRRYFLPIPPPLVESVQRKIWARFKLRTKSLSNINMNQTDYYNHEANQPSHSYYSISDIDLKATQGTFVNGNLSSSSIGQAISLAQPYCTSLVSSSADTPLIRDKEISAHSCNLSKKMLQDTPEHQVWRETGDALMAKHPCAHSSENLSPNNYRNILSSAACDNHTSYDIDTSKLSFLAANAAERSYGLINRHCGFAGDRSETLRSLCNFQQEMPDLNSRNNHYNTIDSHDSSGNMLPKISDESLLNRYEPPQPNSADYGISSSVDEIISTARNINSYAKNSIAVMDLYNSGALDCPEQVGHQVHDLMHKIQRMKTQFLSNPLPFKLQPMQSQQPLNPLPTYSEMSSISASTAISHDQQPRGFGPYHMNRNYAPLQSSSLSSPLLRSLSTTSSETGLTLADVQNKAMLSSRRRLKQGDPSVQAKKKMKNENKNLRCHSCNITDTPEWRRGPDGVRTLCNACGLHYAKLLKRKKMGADFSSSGSTTSSSKLIAPLSEPRPY